MGQRPASTRRSRAAAWLAMERATPPVTPSSPPPPSLPPRPRPPPPPPQQWAQGPIPFLALSVGTSLYPRGVPQARRGARGAYLLPPQRDPASRSRGDSRYTRGTSPRPSGACHQASRAHSHRLHSMWPSWSAQRVAMLECTVTGCTACCHAGVHSHRMHRSTQSHSYTAITSLPSCASDSVLFVCLFVTCVLVVFLWRTFVVRS